MAVTFITRLFEKQNSGQTRIRLIQSTFADSMAMLPHIPGAQVFHSRAPIRKSGSIRYSLPSAWGTRGAGAGGLLRKRSSGGLRFTPAISLDSDFDKENQVVQHETL